MNAIRAAINIDCLADQPALSHHANRQADEGYHADSPLGRQRPLKIVRLLRLGTAGRGCEAGCEHCNSKAVCTTVNNIANTSAADRSRSDSALPPAHDSRMPAAPVRPFTAHAQLPCSALHAMLLAGSPQQPSATSPGSEPAGCASHSTLEGILRPDDCAPSPAAAGQSGCPNWAAAFRPVRCPAGLCTSPPAGPEVVRTRVLAVSRSNCRAGKVLTHPSSLNRRNLSPAALCLPPRLEALPSDCRTRKAGFL